MKRSYIAPDDFEVTPDRLKWAMETFNISENEVSRQTELWHEFEYKRAYGDWGRAWKRWFRQADKYQLLERERTYTTIDEVSEEQIKADRVAAWKHMNKLKGVK